MNARRFQREYFNARADMSLARAAWVVARADLDATDAYQTYQRHVAVDPAKAGMSIQSWNEERDRLYLFVQICPEYVAFICAQSALDRARRRLNPYERVVRSMQVIDDDGAENVIVGTQTVVK